ncbi:hypothetical protein CONPUDRAFT_160957 [Coniophora puteana RWD-64-598 SS2]|uniref:NACHT domain-containing protein n=1 Tax=Coniophora puteana (strain RWD-64-598) TaxID=741705 RepID=A0A5M3N485_CONPW|nr:uncharacterized protein CONPUDRAFT_160957 [Coniophora puteana RWD-64-598 SS2]EIW86118.1 hypothetical protein CONPUDRAFT_160957 [Coniophora puteana RWD-64-598 SS2]
MLDPVQHDAWKSLGEECIHSATFDPAEQKSSQCLPGTRVDLLDQLLDAIHRESGKIIWLSGEAGSGKSTVAHTLAQEFHDNGSLVATFFFSRSHPKHSTTDHLIPTIAYQLGLLHPVVKEVIIKAITDDTQLLKPEKPRHDQFTHLVLRPIEVLKTIWSELGKTMIMLFDGLEQCNSGDHSHHLPQLIRLLVDALHKDTTDGFRVIFTSRPYKHVRDIIAEPPLVSLVRFKMEDFDAKSDIEHFIQMSFINLRQCRGRDPSALGRHFLLSLSKASSNFVVVATLANLIVRASLSERWAIVGALLRTSGSCKVNMLFRDVINSSENPSQGSATISLVLSLRQPMSAGDISHLMRYDVCPILDSMAAIVSAPSTLEPVMIHYPSLRNYLLQGSRPGFTDPAVVQCHLASACLERMERSLTRDMCRLGETLNPHT